MVVKKHTHIVAFVGLAGSGKTSATDYLSAKGFPKIHLGSIVLKAMEDSQIERTWASEQKFREEIRAREGNDFVIKRAIANINDLMSAGQRLIVVDGVYSWSEYVLLKQTFPGQTTFISIVAPKHIRYQRIGKRTERPMTPREVDERDWSEIKNLEKGGPIASADYFIINDGSLDELHAKIDELTAVTRFCKAPDQC